MTIRSSVRLALAAGVAAATLLVGGMGSAASAATRTSFLSQSAHTSISESAEALKSVAQK
ncbi:MAG TPA: hypothetical protein VKB57_22830 [Acidimicrobiales bacterium]|nr:hypothetical protein [Acidimicrobiales bacterium]